MNVVFDIDGTICDNGQSIDEKIEKEMGLISKNNNIIFASARPVRDMLPILSKAFHSSLLIGCNGGIHYKSGHFGKTHHFKENVIREATDFLKKKDIAYVLDGDWYYSLSEVSHPFHDYIRSLSNYEYQEDDLIKIGITKLLVLDGSREDKMVNLFQSFDNKFSLNKHTKDNFFDITPNHNNKYIALKECGLDMKASICFGNDHNDYMMLDNSQISVFVGKKEVYGNADIYTEFSRVHKVIKRLLS